MYSDVIHVYFCHSNLDIEEIWGEIYKGLLRVCVYVVNFHFKMVLDYFAKFCGPFEQIFAQLGDLGTSITTAMNLTAKVCILFSSSLLLLHLFLLTSPPLSFLFLISLCQCGAFCVTTFSPT